MKILPHTQKCSVTTSTGLEKVRVEILPQNCPLLHELKKGKERKGTLFKCLASARAIIGTLYAEINN